jgi:mannose-6-phosphate isomerase-like protein (cupin superfamily)
MSDKQHAATSPDPPAGASVIDPETLRHGEAVAFEGADHGVAASFILDRSKPGAGPAPHRHPYAELWVLEEGRATFRVGDRSLAVGPASVVVAPASTPHCFTNTGAVPFRMLCIHPRGRKERL